MEDAEPVIVAVRSMADRESRVAEMNNTPGNEASAQRLHTIADRIAAGYDQCETSADDDMFGPADAVPTGTPEFEAALAASVAHLPQD